MLFLTLFLSSFAREISLINDLESGFNQMHLAYLGKQERSISWTSLTESESMELFYQLKVIGPQGEMKIAFSNVTKFVEPQDSSEIRYIHTVVLRLKFTEKTARKLFLAI